MMDSSGSYIVDAPSPPLSSRERGDRRAGLRGLWKKGGTVGPSRCFSHTGVAHLSGHLLESAHFRDFTGKDSGQKNGTWC